ncbi:flavin reductase family protein [Aquibacillus sp. 3ASR75-11]|uniref:Flavin reductase family protein n=1 Tax=Terrihalobacillus insolitus TaxID=2950438 RepID=A0A9X3WUQ8_9BACI|nr:flavin reductase family protein [Terrihalobacillus insolitus]MDC3423649.1 flavin reductase family protein [Terrihalobacillus insolitus]
MDSRQDLDPYSSIYDLRSRGVFFVSTTDGKRGHFHFGCWTTQCSHEPPRMLTCFPKEFEGADVVKESGVRALSLAAFDQEEFHDQFFSGDHSIQALGEDKFMYAETGCPILKDAVAYFDCKVSSIIDNGDFLIAIGDIVKGEALHSDKINLNVEYIAKERTQYYRKGPVTLPFKGFDIS